MLNLNVLRQLLADPALRGQISRLISNKVRADAKSLEANALLSRQLIELAGRARRGERSDSDGVLRQLVKEHLDYYETLVNLTLAFNQRLADQLNGVAQQTPTDSAATVTTMRLAVPLGTTVRAPFRLENNRATPIAVGFEMTPFVSESGSEFVSAEVAFDPPLLRLEPGQEGRVELIVVVAPGFTVGSTYLATITLTGLDATQLLVRLVVEAPRETAQPAAGASAVSETVDLIGEAPEPEDAATPSNVSLLPTRPKRPATRSKAVAHADASRRGTSAAKPATPTRAAKQAKAPTTAKKTPGKTKAASASSTGTTTPPRKKTGTRK